MNWTAPYRAPAIARRAAAPYLPLMSFRRILSLLVLFGLILAPVGMLGGAPAMAMNNHSAMAMAMSHSADAAMAAHPCADEQTPSDRQAPDNCCVMTCVAIPAIGGEVAAQLIVSIPRQRLPLAADPHGLEPEAEPPPPKIS